MRSVRWSTCRDTTEIAPRCARDERRDAPEVVPRLHLLLRAALEYRIAVYVRQLQQHARRTGAAHRLK